MAKKKKYDSEDGVWRTVGGRRIFIRNGQDLSSAMKESGKFKNKNEEKRNIKTITQEEYDKLPKDYKGTLKELVDTAEFRGENKDKLIKFYEEQGFNIEEDKTILENENGGTILRPVKVDKTNNYINKNKQYEEMKKRVNEQYEKDIEDARMTGNDKLEESAKKARTEQLRDIDRMQKENRKEYDAYKGTKYERQYDSVEDRYNRDKDFRDRLKDIDKKYNDDKLMSKEEYESYASRLSDRDDYARTSYQDYIEETKNVGSIKQVNDSIRNYDGYDKKNPIQNMANDRIKEKENTLNNDKILLDGMKKRGMKEIDGTTQEDLERRIKKNEDYLKVSKNDSKNWRDQVKKNNELMEKELEDYTQKYDPFGKNLHNEKIHDGYYEIYRNNERRNAKIKKENPTEPYEYVEAYAGYNEKSWRLSGSKKREDGSTDFGNGKWTGKQYTNDEFMEHLTDSNWHGERKQLMEAKLTNQELSYIKDRTTLSQWSVGEELTGSKNVEKMIKEAKSYYSNNSSNLMNRYSGTVDYLQKTTNMSSSEILELLKKIDEDKK